MADHTLIEWSDATWQIVTGCSVVSPGCTNCYAMRLAGTRLQHHPSRKGLTTKSKAGPVWNGKVRFNEGWLRQPLQWRTPRDIFVAAHGDLFHDGVERWMHVKVFAVMAIAQRHRFQILTKRPENMRAFCLWLQTPEGREALQAAMYELGATFAAVQLPLPNVWLGVSVEDQPRADERIPLLLDTPAVVRWISAEPLLGPLDLRPWLSADDGCEHCDDGSHGQAVHCQRDGIPREQHCPVRYAVETVHETAGDKPGDPPKAVWTERVTLDWIVAGGESGPGARPCHPDLARSLRDQCAVAGVPYFLKQLGAFGPIGLGREKWIVRADGSYDPMPTPNGIGHHPPRNGATFVFRVGKKRAGHLLDGVEHRAMPATGEVR